MENNYIKLTKVREFGDVFNDTFAFLKQEAKPLGTALLKFVLPLFLVAGIALAYIQSMQLKTITSNTYDFDFAGYFSKILFAIIIFLFAQNMLMVMLYSYFRLYQIKGPRNFSHGELLRETGRFYIPCLLSSILLGIILTIGFALCIIPGIYLGISLSLFFAVMVIEGKGFGDSFSRSFDLTHKQWWWTLLIILVYIVLSIVFMMILYIPLVFIMVAFMFKQQNAVSPDLQIPLIILIYYAFMYLVSAFFQIVLHVAIVFQYYNIVEKFEGNTLFQKIEQISPNEQA